MDLNFTDANGLTIGSVTVESETVTGITTNNGPVSITTNSGQFEHWQQRNHW